MQYWEMFGYVAGLLTMFGFAPQVYKMYRTKSVSDISPVMLGQGSLGTFLWLLYGIVIQSNPMIVSSTVTIFFFIAGLVLYFKYK